MQLARRERSALVVLGLLLVAGARLDDPGMAARTGGLLVALFTLPHLAGPLLARRLDLARDYRRLLGAAYALVAVLLAAAAEGLGRVPTGVVALLVLVAGLGGPMLTGGLSSRLAELVRAAIPAATRRTGGHPAKRTFQALRIEVNDELGALTRALPAAIGALAVGGRIAVITFHSLEDRIVKQTLAAGATDRTPPELPVPLPERAPVLRLLTRGGEAAGEAEVAANPRAASARVRAAERTRRAA
jgi:hypothetical protein